MVLCMNRVKPALLYYNPQFSHSPFVMESCACIPIIKSTPGISNMQVNSFVIQGISTSPHYHP